MTSEATSNLDENVLDDLMQNNVLFEEDLKTEAKLDQDAVSEDDDLEEGEEHSDQDPEQDDKAEQGHTLEDHSDISEEEDETLDEAIKKEPSEPDHDTVLVEKKPSLASRVVKLAPESKQKKKSYDYATKLNYLFRDARFFLVKSSVSENVKLSKVRGVWSTPPANEGRFNKAFKEARNVLMIFSVKESGKFCGFARLASESSRDGQPVPWILPPGLTARALGGVFKIDWICRKVKTQRFVSSLFKRFKLFLP